MEMEALLLCSIHPRQHRKAINVEKMSCNVKGMINQHKIGILLQAIYLQQKS
jgi:hypothetical protein